MSATGRGLVLALLAGAVAARAGTRYWDGGSIDLAGNGNGVSAGGTGTWNTTTLNWDQGNGLPYVSWTNANNDIAVFGGLVSTVALAQAVTVGGLTFTASGYQIISNTITFGVAGSISNAAGVTATIASSLAGTSPITKIGAGTVYLTASNTFNGGLVITSGTVQVSDGSHTNALGSPNNVITFTGNSTLYDANNTFNMPQGLAINTGIVATLLGAFGEVLIVNGAVSGSGTAKVDAGSGGWDVRWNSTNNTFTGTLQVYGNSGTALLRVNSLPDSASPIQLGRPATANAFGIFEFGSGGSAPLVFSNRQFQLVSTTSGGTIQNNNTAGAHTNTVTILTDLAIVGTGSKPLNLGGSNTNGNRFAGTITNGTGSGISVNKADSGTWWLTGTNTYTGTTSISGGVLTVTSIGNVGGGASSMGAPATVGNGTIAIGNGSGGGTLRYVGSGHTSDRVLNLNGTTGNATLDQQGSGPLKFISDFTATGAGSKTLVLTGSAGATGELAGAVVDNSAANRTALTKTGACVWVLSGTNTFTGPITLATNGGTLRFARPAALYSNTPANWTKASITVNSGATLALNVGGTGEFAASDVTTLLGNLLVTINNNGLRAGASLGFDTANASPTTFTVADNIANSTGTGGGAIGLRNFGGNTLALTGSSTYTGETGVEGGLLRANHGAGLPSGSLLTLTGAVFETGTDLARTGGSAAGNLRITGGTAGFSARSGNAQIAFGTLVTPAALTWGTAPFQPDTLVLNAATADSNLSFLNALNLDGADRTIRVDAATATLSGALTSPGAGGLTKSGAGTLVLQATNTFSGATVVIGGTLRLGDGGTAGALSAAGGVTIATNAAFSVNQSDTVVQGSDFGLLTGAGGFMQVGSGTTVLSAANGYTGPTTVSNGTLLVNGTLAAGSDVTISGGTLGGTGAIGGSVTAAAAANLAPGATVGTLFIGGNLDLSALAASGAGRLRFELAAPSASDRLVVTGALTIGTAVLGINDFVFTDLGGFGLGTYTLITAAGGISGTPDAGALVGSVGGLVATLQIAGGTNLELVVTSGTVPPTVTTPTATTIHTNTATLGATIASDGGSAITSRGTSWSTSPTGNDSNRLAEGGTALGAFSHARTGFTAGGHYYAWGWASNDYGIGYSSASAEFYAEPNAAAAPSFSSVGSAQVSLSWSTNSSMGGVLVVMRQGGAVDATPVDGTTYSASAVFGSGDELGTGNRVVYSGPATNVTITGLSPVTTYHVSLFAYAGAGSLINYQQDDAPVANVATTTRTLLWDANAAASGQTDGGGNWLDAAQWFDGSANASWSNSYPDNARIGNGGSGGAISLGTVTAGSVTFSNFIGTYTLTNGSLAVNSGLVVSAAGSVVLRSSLDGAGGIAKAGTGTLQLVANNSFAGGIALTAGMLQVSDASHTNALGAATNVLTFAGDSTFYNANGLFTMSQGIAVNNGVVATLLGAFGETLIVNGAVTGSGTVRVDGNSNGWDVRFNHPSNTLTGTIQVFGNSGAVTLRVNSLADSTNAIQLGRPGTASCDGALEWSGGATSPLILSNRQVQLVSTTSGGEIQNNNTAASHAYTVTILTDLGITGTGGKQFMLGGSNTNGNRFAGTISNAAGSAISVTKLDSGTWELSGSNTYSGSTSISGGVLAVTSIGMVNGSPSAMGTPTATSTATIVIGGFGAGGTLRYTGAGHTTDRSIDLGGTTGGATLDHQGTGSLKFTSDFKASGAGAKTLTLRASSGSTGEVAGAIVDNSAALTTSVSKAGAGTWVLSGVNAYRGATTNEAGTLVVNGSLSGSGAVIVKTGATLGGTGSVGTVSVSTGATLAPGTATTRSVGEFRILGGLTLAADTLQIDLTNAAATAGTGWDLITVGAGAGTVTFSGSPVVTVALRCASASLPGFSSSTSTSWKIFAAGTLTGARTFVVATNEFTPFIDGSFSVTQNVGDLYVSYTANPPADLVLSMTQSADIADVGTAMSYALTVSNAGPGASTALILSNTLGVSVAYVGSTGGGTQLGSDVIRWTLNPLAAGSSTTLTLNVLAALNQGTFSNRAIVTMPARFDPDLANNAAARTAVAQCPGAPVPTLVTAGNKTVFEFNNLTFNIVASNNDCSTPFMDIGGKPSGATFTIVTNVYTLTGTFSWTPGASDRGTHPIRFSAWNANSATSAFSLLVYVAQTGENTNSAGVPVSQTNWHVSVTNIAVPASGSATVTWASVAGVAYDVYSSANNLGQQTMTWTREVDGLIAAGTQQVGAVGAAPQKYLQVVPAGFPPGAASLWAIVTPSLTPGFSLFAAPLDGSDLKFDGTFGTNLAAVLTGDNGGTGDFVGDEVFLLNADGSYSNLYLDAAGVWRTSGGSVATHQLLPGQGVIVLRNGLTTAQPRFSGPVGNTLAHTNTIAPGASIVTLSEGRYLTPAQAFANPVAGSPVGDYDEEFADRLVFIEPDGSFRPILRLPDGTWLDLTTFSSAGYLFTPGRAAFYIRQTSGGTLQVKF